MPTFRFPQKSDHISISNSSNRNSDQPSPAPPTPKKIPVVFKYAVNHHKSIKEVFLIGTFTSWKDKINMIKSDGDFVTIVDLPEGEHQYKFVVDGRWEHDSNQVNKNSNIIIKELSFSI